MADGVDRLLDLVSSTDSTDDLSDSKIGSADVEAPPEMDDHLRQYNPITANVDRLKAGVGRITALKQKDRVASHSERHEIMAELEKEMDGGKKIGRETKQMLDRLKNDNGEFQRLHAKETAKCAIRRNLYQMNARKFQEAMGEFHAASDGFQTASRDRTKRELLIVDKSLTQEQIDKLVDEGKAMDVMKQALISETTQDAVREIEQRHSDILRLEQSVLEVFELFKDLATLVDLQQEAFDNIEHNITHAAAHVKQGEKMMVSAEKYQKKARNRRCCFLGIMLVVLCVILIPVLDKVLSKSG